MVKIKEEDGKLIFYDFDTQLNEGVELKANDIPAAVCIFENALAKLDRFNRSHVGWEHVTWVGMYTIILDEHMEKGKKIFEKYNKLIDAEIQELIKEAKENWGKDV